jgi:hypothetical protein
MDRRRDPFIPIKLAPLIGKEFRSCRSSGVPEWEVEETLRTSNAEFRAAGFV